MSTIFLEGPPVPRQLPYRVEVRGMFVTRFYRFARAGGPRVGWSVYRDGQRAGYGLRSTEPAAAAAARRLIDAHAREGVRLPGRQRRHSAPRGCVPGWRPR